MAKRGKLGREEFAKIGRGAAVAATGAGLFYGLNALTEFDYGTWQPIVVAGLSVLANTVRKLLGGRQAPQ